MYFPSLEMATDITRLSAVVAELPLLDLTASNWLVSPRSPTKHNRQHCDNPEYQGSHGCLFMATKELDRTITDGSRPGLDRHPLQGDAGCLLRTRTLRSTVAVALS